MSTPGATNDDWKTELQPVLVSLEAERQKALKTVTTAGAIIGALTIAPLLYLAFSGNLFTPLLALLPIALAAVTFGFIYSSATSTYRKGFKHLVLPKLVAVYAEEMDGALEYSAGAGITESEFRSSSLFRAPDRYSSEDLITGNIGATTVRFSEVHAEDRQTRSTGKSTRTEYHTIFKGLFFAADFHKHFHGTTFVLPDTAEKLFGRFGQNLQQLGAKMSFGARELVRLEDPEFERQFVVYSSDQIEARYILSPALMQRLLKFRARCKTDIYLVFSGGHMIVAIPLATGWLEPPALSTPLTPQSLSLCLDQLRFACGIVHDMDLNTRIWSK